MLSVGPWKENIAKFITEKLNQSFQLAEAKQVDDHVEVMMDNTVYVLTITHKKK